MKQVQGICVSGILNVDGRVLVLQRSAHESDPGYWEFPKGKVEFNENPKQAITREYLEETGLKVAISKIIDVYSWDYKRDDLHYHIAEVVYGVDLVPGVSLEDIRLTEHDNYKWVNIDEAADLQPMIDARRAYLIESFAA